MIQERWIHRSGIGILILLNILGNPVPAGLPWTSGLWVYLILALIITLQWSGVVWITKSSWRIYADPSLVTKRLIRSLLLSMLLVAPLMVLSDVAIKYFYQTEQGGLDQPAAWSLFIFYLFNALILCITAVGITEATQYYRQLRTTEKEKEALHRMHLEAQFAGLKQQVNPHFLFNSLNSLSSLIRIDPVKAEHFVEEMSQVYRYLLQSNQDELITLEKEMDFINSYLHLLQTRFGNGLVLHIELPEAYHSSLLPPLTLQLLIENAVKHNEVSTENPLYIWISIHEGNSIEVKNNLQKKQLWVPSEKIGLTNIMTKYQLLGAGEVVVLDGEDFFIVRLPLILKHHLTA
ncbi:MAG: histidine kinase [Saprospiraceae bacterium]|nr:histidine kinase [Saprospiraceae bacterium]